MDTDSTFAIVDIVVVVIVLVFALSGLRIGFVRGVASLLTLVVATYCTYYTATSLDFSFGDVQIPAVMQPFLAFVVVYIVAWLLFRILARLIEGDSDRDHFQKINKPLGLVLGFVKGVTLVFLVVVLLDLDKSTNPAIQESIFVQMLSADVQTTSAVESAVDAPQDSL